VLPDFQAGVYAALERDPEAISATLPAPRGGGMRSAWSGPRRQDMHDSVAGPNIAILVPRVRFLVSTAATTLYNFWIGNGQPSIYCCWPPQARRSCTGSGRGGGGMPVQAGLPSKAAETNLTSASSFPARPPASNSLLTVLEGGGWGRRLAPAGRRLATRIVLVHE
jgi:hypothetical protein